MNKQQKIIVSIVGITIVLLALLGITYAYYLTRIEGNTNTNSISITTANLKLSYGDGNEIITANNIMPGTTIGAKTFTVTNSGNTTVENYKVVLEYAVLENIVPSIFVRPQDFEITTTCVSKNIESDEISGSCNGYTGTWNNESFEMISNTIDEGIRHEYSLTIFYTNPNEDQSDDMGKNLNLKVQIYGETDTSTLNGTITGVDSNYTMKLHSKPKASILTPTGKTGEYKYKFIGVEPGEHTLYVLNESGEEVSSETIIINKGTNSNISGSTITVKENQSNIYITSTNSNGTLSSSATFNPYSDNTNSLAYHIINNSIYNLNGTTFSDNPLTQPIKESTQLYKTDEVDIMETQTFTINSTQLNYYWTYATKYQINQITGKFDFIDPKICKYSDRGCISELINNEEPIYLISSSPYSNSSSTEEMKNTTSLSSIYLVTDASSIDAETVSISTKQIKSISYSIESSLSKTIDDYGTTYYFRGGVTDNYVNFAEMCWRIVRIEGDGSIKIILASSNGTCDSENVLTDTSAIIDYGNYGVIKDEDRYQSFSDYENSENRTTSIKYIFNQWYNSNLSSYANKLKTESICMGDVSKVYSADGILMTEEEKQNNITNYKAFYYNKYLKLNNYILDNMKCDGNNKTASSKIYPLTVEEAIFAGGELNKKNGTYYLVDNISSDNFWTISHAYFGGYAGRAFAVASHGIANVNTDNPNTGMRPTVSLIPGTLILSGNGTKTTPYVIN